MAERKCTNLTLGLLIAFWVVQFGLSALGQDSKLGTNSDEQISALLKSLKDPAWEKRYEAFYNLLSHESAEKWDGRTYLIPSRLDSLYNAHPDRKGELKLALIDLLSTENSKVEAQNVEVKRTGKTLTEQYTNYYGDVIAAVAGLSDPRALNALVGAITTGGMADRGLAKFGPVVVEPLLLKLQSRDVITRAAAVRALITTLQPENRDNFSDDASRQKIKKALLGAASDRDGGVRLAAVYGLALIPDEDTIPVLTGLAASDPSRLPGQADEGGPFYPVRQAAKRVLDQIARSGTTTTPNPK
jgi:HEAT repeat protein